MTEPVFLCYGGIGPGEITALALAEWLRAAGPGPVTLRINSPGGDCFDGLAMYALVKQHGSATAILDGLAASAASFVAFGCKRVVMAREAMLMLHAPHSALAGDAERLREQADLLDKVNGQIAGIYAQRSGKTVTEVENWLSGETWFTAEEAKAAGLVDEVVDGPVEAVPIACSWRFKNAPASIAARLDPTAPLRKENERLKGELSQARESLAAARVDAELKGVGEVPDEVRAALTNAFLADPAGARVLVSAMRPAVTAAVIVASDVAQRNAADEYSLLESTYTTISNVSVNKLFYAQRTEQNFSHRSDRPTDDRHFTRIISVA